MPVALINPRILQWAHKRARIEPGRLAKSASVTPEKILHWEEGLEKPTFKQAQKIADALHIPFGYLFLSHPPEERLPIPDLRRIGDHQIDDVSADLFDLLSETIFKHNWYREYLLEQGKDRLPFIGRFDTNTGTREIAEDIRITLSLRLQDRKSVRSWEQFYDLLVKRAEAVGILVMRSGIVGNNTHRSLDTQEFRGFAISDEISPLIFINSNDAKTAQIFTLVHEIAHLWIGKSGVSNIPLDRSMNVPKKDIEMICNDVAAEVLIPKDSFLKMWQKKRSLEENAKNLAEFFRVSTVVIGRRALDLGYINWQSYIEHYRGEEEKWQRRKEEQSSGGHFYRTLTTRNGRQFVEAVVRSTLDQSLLMNDAGRLLNINPSKIQPLADHLGVI